MLLNTDTLTDDMLDDHRWPELRDGRGFEDNKDEGGLEPYDFDGDR